MSKPLVAEFGDARRLVEAVTQLHQDGHTVLDACTPFRVPELDDLIAQGTPSVRLPMLVGGLVVAALAYGLQWYSAVIDYPINTGGRPLNSWPVFLLVPFEVGMLAAAVSGFVAFLWHCRLPRLYDPVFDTTGIARATQDRFFLLAAQTEDEERTASLRETLRHAGALTVVEQGA